VVKSENSLGSNDKTRDGWLFEEPEAICMNDKVVDTR
jgi:hypothetical protein